MNQPLPPDRPDLSLSCQGHQHPWYCSPYFTSRAGPSGQVKMGLCEPARKVICPVLTATFLTLVALGPCLP